MLNNHFVLPWFAFLNRGINILKSVTQNGMKIRFQIKPVKYTNILSLEPEGFAFKISHDMNVEIEVNKNAEFSFVVDAGKIQFYVEDCDDYKIYINNRLYFDYDTMDFYFDLED